MIYTIYFVAHDSNKKLSIEVYQEELCVKPYVALILGLEHIDVIKYDNGAN